MTGHTEVDGLEILTLEECLTFLTCSRIGRVGFAAAGTFHILPVNFSADPEGGIVFRTTATSILNRVAGQPAAFETDGYDVRDRTGWSVCVRGVGREITDADDPAAQRLQTLSVIPWAAGRRNHWFTITPDTITGRRLPMIAAPSDLGWIPGVVS